jgi:hypothetical protein
MKKTFTLLFASFLASAVILQSCKKDEDEIIKACNGMDLCLSLNDESFSLEADWIVLPQNKNRIFYSKNLGGTNSERIEIDFWGNTTGDYNFAGPINTAGSASFYYYKNVDGTITTVNSTTGTFKLVKNENDKITGTFSGEGKNQENAVVTIKDGNFVEVTKIQ